MLAPLSDHGAVRIRVVAVVLVVAVFASACGSGKPEATVSYRDTCRLLTNAEVKAAAGVDVVSWDATSEDLDPGDVHDCRWREPNRSKDIWVLRLKVTPDQTQCGPGTLGQSTLLPHLGNGGYVTDLSDSRSDEAGALKGTYCLRAFASSNAPGQTTADTGDTTTAELQKLVQTAWDRLAV